MLAVDTNVVLRYLVEDDAAQSTRARAIVEGGPVFVAPTVVLECEWVLRSLYGFQRIHVVNALEAFCAVPNVTVGEAEAVSRALRLARRGMDFADALHLASAAHCAAFVTFDKRLVRKAKGVIDIPVRPA